MVVFPWGPGRDFPGPIQYPQDQTYFGSDLDAVNSYVVLCDHFPPCLAAQWSVQRSFLGSMWRDAVVNGRGGVTILKT